jgi:hypothetical protein
MLERRGSVFIAPADFFPADGRMVDPAFARFRVSWQNDDGGEGALEDNEVVGAEAAIAWGRKRSAEIWIRLGHRGDTYFWAGEGQQPVEEGEDPYPDWPPSEPPPGAGSHPAKVRLSLAYGTPAILNGSAWSNPKCGRTTRTRLPNQGRRRDLPRRVSRGHPWCRHLDGELDVRSRRLD